METLRQVVSDAIVAPAHAEAFVSAFGYRHASGGPRYYHHVGPSLSRCLDGGASGSDVGVAVMLWLSQRDPCASEPTVARLLEWCRSHPSGLRSAWERVSEHGLQSFSDPQWSIRDAPVPCCWTCLHSRGEQLMVPCQLASGDAVIEVPTCTVFAGAPFFNPLQGEYDAKWATASGVSVRSLAGLAHEEVRCVRLALDVDGRYTNEGSADLYYLQSEQLVPREVMVLRVRRLGALTCCAMAMPAGNDHVYRKDNRILRVAGRESLADTMPNLQTMVGAQALGLLSYYAEMCGSDAPERQEFSLLCTDSYIKLLGNSPRSHSLARLVRSLARSRPSVKRARHDNTLYALWRQDMPSWARRHHQQAVRGALPWHRSRCDNGAVVEAALRGALDQARLFVERGAQACVLKLET